MSKLIDLYADALEAGQLYAKAAAAGDTRASALKHMALNALDRANRFAQRCGMTPPKPEGVREYLWQRCIENAERMRRTRENAELIPVTYLNGRPRVDLFAGF